MYSDPQIERATHVIFNPDTQKWEVWELTPLEALMLTEERFGLDVAIENMNYDDNGETNVHDNRTD